MLLYMLTSNHMNVNCVFSLKSNLKIHQKNHKREMVKLYTCQVCEKRFYYLSKIVEHMDEVHPDVFPYNCEVCNKNFSRSETLRLHKKNHTAIIDVPQCTAIIDVPQCNICNKSFQTNFNMKR